MGATAQSCDEGESEDDPQPHTSSTGDSLEAAPRIEPACRALRRVPEPLCWSTPSIGSAARSTFVHGCNPSELDLPGR